MRIICPACRAAYEVPERLLAAGKPVRCAKCERVWTPMAEPPVPPPAEPPEPPPRPAPRLPSLRLQHDPPAEDERLPPQDYETFRSRRGAGLAWALSLLLLAALGWAAVTWRGEVMAAWPPSERLYAALGLR